MTTIAYKDGVLAWDSQWSDEDTGYRYMNRKGWKDDEAGFIVAMAGYPEVGLDVLQRILNEDSDMEIRCFEGEDLDLIILWRDGTLEVYDEYGRGLPFDSHGFYAWGSGAKAALAAMHMGATASGAVDVACKVDVWSHPPVSSESW